MSKRKVFILTRVSNASYLKQNALEGLLNKYTNRAQRIARSQPTFLAITHDCKAQWPESGPFNPEYRLRRNVTVQIVAEGSQP